MERFNFPKKEQIERLPKSPGVYYLKNGRKILYIGKASNIKERIKNHFYQPSYQDRFFIDQVNGIKYTGTDSEIEALVLEANLIKKYQPKYNIVWKDDKNYFFVGATKEDFPRVFITHQPFVASTPQGLRPLYKKDKGTERGEMQTEFVGPFVDGRSLKQTLKTLRRIFPYRTCRNFPSKPCLWYQLNRCPAPCLNESKLAKQIPITFEKMKKECKNNAKLILQVLKGKKSNVLKLLKKEMKDYSFSQNYEKAGKVRDQITSLERIMSHAKIFETQPSEKLEENVQKILQNLLKAKNRISRIEAYDISNIQGQEAAGSMAVFKDGVPEKKSYRKFKIRTAGSPDDIAMIKEVLSRRFRHSEWHLPDAIFIDGGKAQFNAALEIKKNNRKLRNVKVLSLAKRNNELFIEGKSKPLLLKNLPRAIFNLILQLRDEAHRFAQRYHHKLKEIDFKGKYC